MKNIYRKSQINKKAFTLLELLIVMSVVVALAIVALITLNPKKQVEKSQDTKRKQELTQLSKVLEDYYNDKSCYPPPSDICYNYTPGQSYCNICGNESLSPSFSPYISSLPCDPQHPTKKYLYEFDDETCPTWFRIFTDLSNNADPIISSIGCSAGCGINYVYDFGVSSPNTSVGTNSTTPTPGQQILCQDDQSVYRDTSNGCNACENSYLTCKASFPNDTIYFDRDCTIICY